MLTKNSKYFDFWIRLLYSKNTKKNGVDNMDVAVMKRLNRQGFIFVGIHSLIVLNFAIEMLLF